MDRLSDAAVEQFIAVRRDIHRHPELAFSERRTAALVAARVTSALVRARSLWMMAKPLFRSTRVNRQWRRSRPMTVSPSQ